jgi:hypothetical protein
MFYKLRNRALAKSPDLKKTSGDRGLATAGVIVAPAFGAGT